MFGKEADDLLNEPVVLRDIEVDRLKQGWGRNGIFVGGPNDGGIGIYDGDTLNAPIYESLLPCTSDNHVFEEAKIHRYKKEYFFINLGLRKERWYEWI